MARPSGARLSDLPYRVPRGAIQLNNVSTGLAVVGLFQRPGSTSHVIIDVAHNSHGAEARRTRFRRTRSPDAPWGRAVIMETDVDGMVLAWRRISSGGVYWPARECPSDGSRRALGAVRVLDHATISDDAGMADTRVLGPRRVRAWIRGEAYLSGDRCPRWERLNYNDAPSPCRS